MPSRPTVLSVRAVRRAPSILLLGLGVGLQAALVLVLVGCGYQLVRYGETLGDVQRIALRGFANDTFEPLADEIVSEAITREFLRRGAVELVEDPEQADLVIVGRVTDALIARRSFSSVSFALEYEVRLRLDIQVTRPDGTLVFVDQRSLSGSELYLSSADLEVNRTYREEAMRVVADVLAGRLHDSLYERVAP